MGNSTSKTKKMDSFGPFSSESSIKSSENPLSDPDPYKDEPEETQTCTSLLFTKKAEAITMLGIGLQYRQRSMSMSSCMDRSSEDDMNCILSRSSSWSNLIDEPYYTKDERDMEDGDFPTLESDLRPSAENGCRMIWVVTTAALPWMTGTAINPLLRAAYFSQMNRPFSQDLSTVTLVIPWLESAEDRVQLYGPSWRHKTQKDQDAYIRAWIRDKALLPLEASPDTAGIFIQFYPARWHARMNSIFAMGDICSLLGEESLDVCFLEEPEHLNWYRAPGKHGWKDKFRHVVGVGHTNYLAYFRQDGVATAIASPALGMYSSWMVRAYCHKLIKLSGVLQTFSPEKEVVANVHGIRMDFLSEGRKNLPKNGVYFLGKLLWAKGLDHLIELEGAFQKQTGAFFSIDIVGSGPDEDDIRRAFAGRRESHDSDRKNQIILPKSRYEFRKSKIPANFLGRQDHLQACKQYKIFVNPSLSEVLCTATAEALAMGKFAILPAHPSNQFFEQFPNCLVYTSRKEFVTLMQYALTHNPLPMSEELSYHLTWDAATERCMDASVIKRRDAKRADRVGETKLDRNIAKLHHELGKGQRGNIFRAVIGAGPVADQFVPQAAVVS